MGKKLSAVVVAVFIVMFNAQQALSVCCYKGPTGRCYDGTKPTPRCGFGKCNFWGCNCDGGCRYYDNGDTSQPYVTTVHLFGNGKAFGEIYHVLVVLETTDGKYHLLEVGKSKWGAIDINHQVDSSKTGVLNKRNNKKASLNAWGSATHTWRPWSAIEKLVDMWDGQRYNLLEQNCRHFVGAIHQICNSDKIEDLKQWINV